MTAPIAPNDTVASTVARIDERTMLMAQDIKEMKGDTKAQQNDIDSLKQSRAWAKGIAALGALLLTIALAVLR